MYGRIPRLVLVAPIAAALAVTLTAGPAAVVAAETPALRSISSRLDGALSTVLIEATEPVAYLTSQPDPLTVLVDLRNVNAGSLGARPITDTLAPVGSVAVEAANAPDGVPVARVRVNLDRVAPHRVRSSRNTILVEVDRAGATGATSATGAARVLGPVRPAAAQDAPAAAARRSSAGIERAKAGATALRSVNVGEVENGYVVTLAGNGALSAANVDEAKDLPPRVLLDFHGVSTGTAPAVTSVKNDDIERVRVATNSRDPLITRVVIDLARKIPYTVETVGEELRILFRKAVDATSAMVSAAAPAEPAPAPEPAAPEAPAVPMPEPVVALPRHLQ